MKSISIGYEVEVRDINNKITRYFIGDDVQIFTDNGDYPPMIFLGKITSLPSKFDDGVPFIVIDESVVIYLNEILDIKSGKYLM